MSIHSHLTDAQRKIEAMYHLEVCFEPYCGQRRKSDEEIDAHITAAHYIVQSMFGGFVAENYDEVIKRAMDFDAADEAADVINRAKNT